MKDFRLFSWMTQSSQRHFHVARIILFPFLLLSIGRVMISTSTSMPRTGFKWQRSGSTNSSVTTQFNRGNATVSVCRNIYS